MHLHSDRAYIRERWNNLSSCCGHLNASVRKRPSIVIRSDTRATAIPQAFCCRPFRAFADPCTTWISPSVRSQSPAPEAAQPPRHQNATSPASLIVHARPHSSSLDSRWYRPCHPPPDKAASGQAWLVYLHCSPNGSSLLQTALRRPLKSQRPAMTACSGARTGRIYTLASGRASQRV